MTVDSLEQLSAAFGEWRTGKKHLREKVPAELLRRARRAAKAYGYERVARAAKVDKRRLENALVGDGHRTGAAVTPAYSRVELVRPQTSTQPFAELEMPSGIKVRLYSETRETLDLLTAVCGSGGGR